MYLVYLNQFTSFATKPIHKTPTANCPGLRKTRNAVPYIHPLVWADEKLPAFPNAKQPHLYLLPQKQGDADLRLPDKTAALVVREMKTARLHSHHSRQDRFYTIAVLPENAQLSLQTQVLGYKNPTNVGNHYRL